jgi:hypothetical protein
MLLFPLIAARKAIKNISIIGSKCSLLVGGFFLGERARFPYFNYNNIFIGARCLPTTKRSSDEIYGLISNASARRLHFN